MPWASMQLFLKVQSLFSRYVLHGVIQYNACKCSCVYTSVYDLILLIAHVYPPRLVAIVFTSTKLDLIHHLTCFKRVLVDTFHLVLTKTVCCWSIHSMCNCLDQIWWICNSLYQEYINISHLILILVVLISIVTQTRFSHLLFVNVTIKTCKPFLPSFYPMRDTMWCRYIFSII